MDSQMTAPQTTADPTHTQGHDSAGAVKSVAGTASQEAGRTAREATDQARMLWSQTRSELTDQAGTQQARAASGLRDLAQQLGSMARQSDQDGMARSLVDDVARRADDAATWLDQRDPGSLLEEARSFARQRPGTFLAIAAGVGVLAGRLSRSLVDEARDSDDSTGSTRAGQFGDTNGSATGYGTSTGGYGTGSGATGSTAGTGMPAAGSRTASTTASTPVTPGAAPATVGQGNATVPGSRLPDAPRSTQPIAPDGTPSPIDDEGNLTARGDR